MPPHVCPWWIGYLLVSPLRRLMHSPGQIVAPYVHEGMTVLEPGPGMGFFTLELARRVGASGQVVAVEIQSKMLGRLKRRAAKVGLFERVDARLAQPDSMGLADLAGKVDFALAFAVVHEAPSKSAFFAEIFAALKSSASLLFVEPAGHVKLPLFNKELACAAEAGFHLNGRPAISHCHAALLKKPA
jgi:ubiquinone/menaquinone biosynthesis C-methylase UbiE